MVGYKKKIALVLTALTAIIASLFLQGTLAYYSVDATATNIVTMGDISLKIIEKTSDGRDYSEQDACILTSEPVSRIVSVKNIGGHPFWLRIKLTDGIHSYVSSDIFELDINSTDWICGNDGYYYYKQALEPGAVTEKLFSQVKASDSIDSSLAGQELALTITAYAVQSENNPASSPLEVPGWPAEG